MSKKKSNQEQPRPENNDKNSFASNGTPPEGSGIAPQINNSADSESSGDTLPDNLKFSVAGFGASAGGYEAFTAILKNLPPDTGLAFVFVQHLDPLHESFLTELLSKQASMPVNLITDGILLEPDNIYIIPPNKEVIIKQKKLHLLKRDKTDPHRPIDTFFKSLADEEKSNAIGIILSGTGTDGTDGLKAIKQEGGITFAQEESSAKYDGMPRSAILSGDVDFILTHERIAQELARIGTHPFINYMHMPEETVPLAEDDLAQVFRKLKTSFGVDFAHYKLNTIRRRIIRRMLLLKFDTISAYLQHITDNRKELNDLYHDLLINVTNFFRDPEIFKDLAKKVFPRLLENVQDHGLRIWVPGCSTGEEPYSIAICLMDFLASQGVNIPVQIFATDISDRAIDKARIGIYSAAITEDVPPKYLKEYFVKVERGYQINKMIRDMCIFARQDITRDPPFSKVDFISCRNLLIYLSPALQSRIIQIFHYALKPDGILLLGGSESIGTYADMFTLMDKKHKLYLKKNITHRSSYEFSYTAPNVEKNSYPPKVSQVLYGSLDVQKEADKVILSKYSPPGLLVNENLEIIQFRGVTSPYVEPSPGSASLNLFKMTKEGLTIELHSAIAKAKKDGKPVNVKKIKIKKNGSYSYVDVDVIPIKPFPEANDNFFLILFSEEGSQEQDSIIHEVVEQINKDENEEERLRNELAVTKEYLQSIIEDREATNEELRSALEEIQSSNEELQSTNEELETAKEELQSTNEELITVNEELENRNVELNQLNNDLVNLLGSVKYPTIMLDKELRIRRFTPEAEKVWNLISTDLGRPVTDINTNLIVPDLKNIIEEVIDNLATRDINIQDKTGRWYSMRIRPYKTLNNKIEGVVIAIVDFENIIKHIDTTLMYAEAAEAVVEGLKYPVVILNSDLSVLRLNRQFENILKLSRSDIINHSIYEICGGAWNTSEIKEYFSSLNIQKNDLPEQEVEINFPHLG